MKVVTLEGRSMASFIEERNKLLSEGASSPPIYTTQADNVCDHDNKVYITMEQFLAKKRNWDFWAIQDIDGVLSWYSKFMFEN